MSLDGEIGAFREVLAEKPVGILAARPLSRAARVTEVDRDASVDAEAHVLGHFLALVPSERAAQLLGQRSHPIDWRATDVFRYPSVREVGQHHVAAAAFDHAFDRQAAGFAEKQIALPVARHGSVGGLGRALGDGKSLEDRARARWTGYDMNYLLKQLIFSLIGRRAAYRIGRALYQIARGDGPNDMVLNGEMLVQKCVVDAWKRNDLSRQRLVVFDVGANVGDWSSALLGLLTDATMREAVDLYVFEPVPSTLEFLKNRLGTQAQAVHYQRLALSSGSGEGVI